MIIEYETRLKNPRVADENGHSKVITQIWFSVHGVDAETGAEGECHGSVTPAMPEAGADFMPFESVTEKDVKAWVEASPAYKDARDQVEGAIRQAIRESNPKAEAMPTRFPWEAE